MLVMSELQKIELAKLEVLELQYWKAWRKVKRIAFLDGVQDVIKLRMDILNGYTHLPPPDAADVQAEVDDILRKIMHSEESRP